jgi:cyclopropane fatty-acyl-phospholipid synthase-like methyltransferase
MAIKPFSQACENNKQPILAELTTRLARVTRVLEIGSGTGQHAVYFAPRLPHLVWQASDLEVNHAGISMWLDDVKAPNLISPISFKIGEDPWPKQNFDGVFSANTAHIMQPSETETMMGLIAQQLPAKGVFCQYGPFKVDGQYTSESNAHFDQHLLSQGCGGMRDIRQLQTWATPMVLVERIDMPANNMLLVWQKA